MAYDVGDRIRIGNHVASASSAFTDIDGNLTDPTAVLLTIKRYDGTFLEYGYPSAGDDGTMTRESLGRYYVDVTLDVPGVWRIKIDGTGAVIASEQTTITVNGSLVL